MSEEAFKTAVDKIESLFIQVAETVIPMEKVMTPEQKARLTKIIEGINARYE